MSAPCFIPLCARGHGYANVDTLDAQPTDRKFRSCPCGRRQLGFVYHYGKDGAPITEELVNDCAPLSGGLSLISYEDVLERVTRRYKRGGRRHHTVVAYVFHRRLPRFDIRPMLEDKVGVKRSVA